MILKKRLLKFTLWTFIMVIIGSFLTYYYLKNTWNDIISEDELIEFVTKIKFAEELPERFYELYEQEYPSALSTDLNNQIWHGLFSKTLTKSPSLLASMISDFSREATDSTKISNRKAYVIAWKLEEETTQKECLNWALRNYKFDLYIHGINEVATFYFKKNVSDLNENELNDIIALLKKPSIVNVPNRTDDDYQ